MKNGIGHDRHVATLGLEAFLVGGGGTWAATLPDGFKT